MLDHEVEQEYMRVSGRLSASERERVEELRIADASSPAYAAALFAAISKAEEGLE